MPKEEKISARLDTDGLTLREALFARLYLSNGGNGAQASRDAGYKRDGNVQASELLKRPQIKKVIERERKKILSELDVKVERVIKELARVHSWTSAVCLINQEC